MFCVLFEKLELSVKKWIRLEFSAVCWKYFKMKRIKRNVDTNWIQEWNCKLKLFDYDEIVKMELGGRFVWNMFKDIFNL